MLTAELAAHEKRTKFAAGEGLVLSASTSWHVCVELYEPHCLDACFGKP